MFYYVLCFWGEWFEKSILVEHHLVFCSSWPHKQPAGSRQTPTQPEPRPSRSGLDGAWYCFKFDFVAYMSLLITAKKGHRDVSVYQKRIVDLCNPVYLSSEMHQLKLKIPLLKPYPTFLLSQAAPCSASWTRASSRSALEESSSPPAMKFDMNMRAMLMLAHLLKILWLGISLWNL